MDTGTILLIAGVFYFVAHGLTFLFQLTRIPDVLILVFVGIVIGPIAKLAEVQDFGRMGTVMTVIALAIILFESGTKLKLQSMGKSLGATLLLTFATVIATIVILSIGALPFLGGDMGLALLTGAMLCGTSSAVVIPLVRSLKVGEKAESILVMESALTDVICIVLTFALLESMLSGGISVYGISLQVLKSLGFAALVGIVGGLFWLSIWNKVREIPSSVFTTIAFAFILYGAAELLGISGAIATLTFGITLANLPLLFKSSNFPTVSKVEGQFYEEIVFLLKTFFFIFLGVSIRITSYKIVTVSILLVAAVYFLRLWITRYSMPKEGVSLQDAIVTSAMVPKGLAPAVLVSLVMQKGVPHADNIQAFVFSVVILSIIFTAALIPLTRSGFLAQLYNTVLCRFSENKSDENLGAQ
ncbi:MAG: cation:proton antiporter [Bdellovibrionales bacterium]|nr:cation:proton antiporter [Bdellovibrionales bacterium]